jgi:hypothetical protein
MRILSSVMTVRSTIPISLTINSTMAYVSAFLVTTVLHECGHAFVGHWLGSAPVLHHNHVEHFQRDLLPLPHQVWIALAGPLVSLVQGILVAFWMRDRQGGGPFRLFMLWTMLLGFGNFLGYLMTGPLFTAGDIGKVHQLLDVPLWIRIGVAIVGAAALTVVAYRATLPFLRFAPEQHHVQDATSRVAFNGRIIILPWVIGSLVMTLLYLPVVAVVSIIYPISSGMVFIFPWRNAKRVQGAIAQGSSALTRSSLPLAVALLLGVVLFRAVLAPGIPF